jgi:hypothetical protein
MKENDELKHKYEVSEKLYQMMKDHFSKYVNKSLTTTEASYDDQNNTSMLNEILLGGTNPLHKRSWSPDKNRTALT